MSSIGEPTPALGDLMGQGAEAKVWRTEFCGKPCVCAPAPSLHPGRGRICG